MRHFLIFSSILSLTLQADTISLFDGKTLDGWEGDKRYWSIEDGAITGKSTAESPCKQTTYLTYTKKQFANFELNLSFRFLTDTGNGGVQYRSQWQNKEKFTIKGYQADMETGANYSGILYEQDGRGIVAKRGQNIQISPSGKKTVSPKPIKDADKVSASIQKGKWNSYRVVADGNTLMHQINGFTTIRVEDNETNRSAVKGLLALQLHAGPPMTVQYKDIKMLELADSIEKPVKDSLTVADGFSIEKIYSVDKKTEGSWVSICFDDKGFLYTSDQYGSLFKITLKDGQISSKERVDNMGHAQGLCWAYGSLYVTSDKKGSAGVHRLTDTNNDGKFDKREFILPIRGGGEHGTHGLMKSPDGDGIYLIVGNHTHPPKDAVTSFNKNWAEDTLHPHFNDASGHAVGIKAPGGTLIKLSADGKKREIIATGMRNTYDIAASPTGSIFGYDSDMEWDIGTPWYRPTRVLHLVKGAEYGWRTGTAKWPEYYADSLGSVIDIGPGCPTGVLFGTGAKFPAKYQKALFILDWTFGKIYALHLSPDETTYSAKKEIFVSGRPLPVTDAAIGPDGAMYFTTGGRRLKSGVYRVSYTGNADTTSVATPAISDAQEKLKHIQKSTDVEALWNELGSDDRMLRYAARISLERLDINKWVKHYQMAGSPQHIITASLALSRNGAGAKIIFSKLLEIDFKQLNEAQKLEYLRAISLASIRTGKPVDTIQSELLKKLDSQYPSASSTLNRELCRVLVYLESAQVLKKTIFLMQSSVAIKEDIPQDLLIGNTKYAKDFKNMLKNQPDSQALHYALMLKNHKLGWDEATVRAYYKWLASAEMKSGGNSYKGFIKKIRSEAMKNLKPELLVIAKESSKIDTTAKPMVMAKGPGRAWTLEEATEAVKDLSKADIVNGKHMFQATLCARCHTHSKEGGSSGPDLTNLVNRFEKKDVLKAIIDPSEVISDQYTTTVFQLKDGATMQGKIMKEDEAHVHIAASAFDLTVLTPVLKSSIVKRTASTISTMPPSLINSLNPDELRDLMLYLTTQPK